MTTLSAGSVINGSPFNEKEQILKASLEAGLKRKKEIDRQMQRATEDLNVVEDRISALQQRVIAIKRIEQDLTHDNLELTSELRSLRAELNEIQALALSTN